MLRPVLKSGALLIAMLVLFGCSGGIRDSAVSEQVQDYFSNLKAGDQFNNVSYNKYFEVQQIVVKDKQIKEKECIVTCAVTSKCKTSIKSGARLFDAYAWLIGRDDAFVGDLRTKEIKFLFKKQKKGWHIQTHIL